MGTEACRKTRTPWIARGQVATASKAEEQQQLELAQRELLATEDELADVRARGGLEERAAQIGCFSDDQ